MSCRDRSDESNAEKCISWCCSSGVKGCAQNIAGMLGNESAGWLQPEGNKSQFPLIFIQHSWIYKHDNVKRGLRCCFKSNAGSCCGRHRTEKLMENLAMIELFPRSKNWFWWRNYCHKSFRTPSVKSFHVWTFPKGALQWKFSSFSVDFLFSRLFIDWKAFPRPGGINFNFIRETLTQRMLPSFEQLSQLTLWKLCGFMLTHMTFGLPLNYSGCLYLQDERHACGLYDMSCIPNPNEAASKKHDIVYKYFNCLCFNFRLAGCRTFAEYIRESMTFVERFSEGDD